MHGLAKVNELIRQGQIEEAEAHLRAIQRGGHLPYFLFEQKLLETQGGLLGWSIRIETQAAHPPLAPQPFRLQLLI